jgi:uncharacterized membrane protein YdjX (TVP38/TMEM64 family)
VRLSGWIRLLRLAGLLVLLAGLIAVAVWIGVPSRDQIRTAVTGLGWWAPVGFAGLYGIVCLSPLPKTVFTLAAGATFGVAGGVVVVVAGALLGAFLAFYLGRLLGRDTLRWFTGGRLDALDGRVARRGFRAILVARLIPVVPFTAVNYLAGVSAVRLRDFVAATAVGILPTTTATVTIGAYGWQPGAWPMWAAVATLVVFTAGGLIADRYRRRRARRLPAPPAPPVASLPDRRRSSGDSAAPGRGASGR